MGPSTKANNPGLPTLAPKRLVLAASIAALFCGFSVPAFSADTETLLDKLREKGVLTEEEYQEMRTEARTERRTRALKEASEEEKRGKKAESAASELTGKFKDGFLFESGDGRHAFSVNGRIQGDYRAFEKSTAANTFDVRRAYLGAKGKVYDDITFNVTGDFAQSSGNVGSGSGAVQLAEGYVNFGWIKWAQFRVGQFQMPFSLEKITSDLFNNFQERNIGDVMSPDKLRGVMVHGSPTTGLYYGVGVTNGNGAKNTNDTNTVVDGKEAVGRLAVNIAQMLDNKNSIYHLGVSYAETSMAPGAAFSGRTEARGITFFTPNAFTGSNVERKQAGLETALAYGPVKLQAESITTNYKGTLTGGTDYDQDIKAYYASINWLVTGEKFADAYTNGVFGRIKPNSNFTTGGGTGAWEVGVRFSQWSASDFAGAPGSVAAGGFDSARFTSKAKATTVGLKWITNPNTRILLNYIDTKFDTPVLISAAQGSVDSEKALTLRAQFDF